MENKSSNKKSLPEGNSKIRIRLSLKPVPGATVKPSKPGAKNGNKPLPTTISNNGAKKPAQDSVPQPATKRRAAYNPSKPLALPPLASPGLLTLPPPPSTAITTIAAAAKQTNAVEAPPPPPASRFAKVPGTCYVAPQTVFAEYMALAGYLKARTHRGSSVTRVVGDMFDSNVKLAHFFPPLLPPGTEPAPLLSQLSDSVPNQPEQSLTLRRKRRRLSSFTDMMPISLVCSQSASFVEQRQEFVRLVQAREAAIVAQQEDEEEEAKIKIPPIPSQPVAPSAHLDDPKGLLAHLDPAAFATMESRYVGLQSNGIADPLFVGAIAPGVAGILSTSSSSSAGNTGLATASVSGSSTGVVALTLSAAHYDSLGTTPTSGAQPPATVPANNTSAAAPASATKPLDKNEASRDEKTPAAKAAPSETKKKQVVVIKRPSLLPVELKPTATANALSQKIEGDAGAALRTCITRAAVYAGRVNRATAAFTGPDGVVYPDISKAFGAHSGVKPCDRCKGNKQGVSEICVCTSICCFALV
jgi:hypothetical protein